MKHIHACITGEGLIINNSQCGDQNTLIGLAFRSRDISCCCWSGGGEGHGNIRDAFRGRWLFWVVAHHTLKNTFTCSVIVKCQLSSVLIWDLNNYLPDKLTILSEIDSTSMIKHCEKCEVIGPD